MKSGELRFDVPGEPRLSFRTSKRSVSRGGFLGIPSEDWCKL